MPPRSSYLFLAAGPIMLALAAYLAMPDASHRPDPSLTATAAVAAAL